MDDTRVCTKCGEDKPVTEFYKRRGRPAGYYSWCRVCLTASSAQWVQQNPERRRESTRRTNAARYARLTDAEREQEKERKRSAYLADRENILQRMRERHRANRAAVFAHYGTQCACCGTPEDLQIDHIAGGGKQWHAATFGSKASAQMVYGWLVRNSFPPGFQPLCGTCNRSKKDSSHCRVHQSA